MYTHTLPLPCEGREDLPIDPRLKKDMQYRTMYVRMPKEVLIKNVLRGINISYVF